MLFRSLHERTEDPDACWGIQEEWLKRGLAACSLTCKHWAVALRPALFVTLVLRCAEDLDLLFSFLNCPMTVGSPLPSLIMKIGVQLDGTPQRPWMHRLHQLSQYLERHSSWRCWSPVRYDVHITGGGSGKLGPYSTHLLPFQHLPRPFPHMHPRVSVLRLKGLHLRRERDLLGLVCSLPELHWCTMTCISFAHMPSSAMTIPGRRFHLASPEGLFVEASDCGDCLGGTQLAIASIAFFAPSLLGLNSHDWEILRETVTSYTQSSHRYVSFFTEDKGVRCILMLEIDQTNCRVASKMG